MDFLYDSAVWRLRGEREPVTTDDALRLSRERYRRLVETVPHGIQENDIEGRITYANRTQHLILGYPEGELVGRSIWDFHCRAEDRDALRRYLRTIVLEQPKPLPYITKNRRRDGTVIDLQVDWDYVRDVHGDVLGFVSVLTDVTERTRIEDELRQAKAAAEAANRAKTVFLGTMSHELRTPLNAMIGMARILARSCLGDRQRRFAESIHRASNHLLELVDEILEYARVESGGLECVESELDPREIIARVIRGHRRGSGEKRLELQSQVDADVPSRVLGDPDRLRRVLHNIVANAVKFTTNGRVTVRSSVVGPVGDGVTIRFEVEDTGIGIPCEEWERVFDGFTQVDESLARPFGGLGLGLGTAKSLVELMGGEIGVHSDLGEGTTVHIVIPFRTPTAELAPCHPTTEGPAGWPSTRPPTALVVGPAEEDRAQIRLQLEMVGVEVTEAGSGSEAIDRCLARDTDVLVVHCATVDPDSLVTILREKHDHHREVAVIGLADPGRDRRCARCRTCQAAACVARPFAGPRLQEAVLTSMARLH